MYKSLLLLVSTALLTHASPPSGDAALQHLKNIGQYESLGAALTGARYAVKAADGDKARAQNSAHGIKSTFTPDGLRFDVKTGGATHSVSWRLASLGYTVQTIVPAGQIMAEGQRVELRRDALQLTEWYHNTPGGLEHGFTLARRPGGNPRNEPLRLVLEVAGDLTPRAAANGQSIELLNAAGQTVLAYSRLKVWDANGVEFPAVMQAADGQVTLAVNEAAALYPLTIDPTFAQQAYVKSGNPSAEDRFGVSVAVSGDIVVIGADGEDDDATGVNGDPSHNSNAAPFSGAAYVFVRSGLSWTQQAYLKASNTEAADAFGFSVAVSGDTVVIGAYGEDSDATGVDGNQGDNNAPNAGAAYVFVRNGTNWTQQAYLKASNTGTGGDRFGFKVGVSDDTVVVGSPDEDSSATGFNGNQSDNGNLNSGAAYVFVRNGTTWSQQAYLKASNGGFFDNFGSSVAVSDETVVVGAKNEASSSTGVNHPTGQGNNSALSAGAAYVFVRNGTTWSQQAYLKASNTGSADEFGDALAVSGDTVVIGARGEDSNATGSNGDQKNNGANESGAAYVFLRTGAIWAQQAYLKASNTGGFDYFGKSVAVSDDTVVVGAYGEASNAIGVNHPTGQDDNTMPQAGAAYVFVRSGTNWTQQSYLKAGNTDATAPFNSFEPDLFGYSVAVSGNTVVVGAYGEDGASRGINGDSSNNSAREAGAAYVFGPQLVIKSPPHLSTIGDLQAIRVSGFGFVGNPNLYIIRLSDGAFWTELGWASKKSSAILPTTYNFAAQSWVSVGSLPRIGGKFRNTTMANGDYNIIAIAYGSLGEEIRADVLVTVKYSPAFSISGFTSTPTMTGATIHTGNPWRFTAVLASTVSDLRLRVQSTLTPNQESSWKDVIEGATMSRLDSNWTFNSPAVLAGKRYFRVIASAPGYPNETSDYIGPVTVEGFAAYEGLLSAKTLRPLRTGTEWTFNIVQTSLFPDQRLRVQSTTDWQNESSWSDLPGGGQMTHVGSKWTLVTSEIPLGDRYFRVIAAAPTYADLASGAYGRFTVGPALPRDVIPLPSGNYGLLSIPELQDPVEVYMQALSEAFVYININNGMFFDLLAKAAITLAAAQNASIQLTIAEGQTLTTPGLNVGPNGQLLLPGEVIGSVNLIGFDAASLIGNDSGTLIGLDAASLIGNDSGTLQSILASGALTTGNSPIVSHDSGSVISHDSSSLIGNDGGSLIGNDGGTFQTQNSSTVGGKTPFQSIKAAVVPSFTGVMTVTGDYNQEFGAGMAIAIAGLNTAGTGSQEYDQLFVSGRADLGGVIGFGFFNPSDPKLVTGTFQPVLGAIFDVVVASNIITHDLVIRGPIWGDGLHFNWRVVNRADGKQALRLVATRLDPFLVLQSKGGSWEVAYPTNFVGYSLQRSANLTSTNWTAIAPGTNRIFVDRTNAAGFYRMFKP